MQGETDNGWFHLISPPRLHPLLPYPSAFQEPGETGEGQLSYKIDIPYRTRIHSSATIESEDSPKNVPYSLPRGTITDTGCKNLPQLLLEASPLPPTENPCHIVGAQFSAYALFNNNTTPIG